MSTNNNDNNGSAAKTVKDMSGYIAKNDRGNNDRRPHWKGKVRIEGKDWLLSLWIKDDNPDMMSVSVTDPEKLPKRDPAKTSSAPSADDPFGDLFGSSAS